MRNEARKRGTTPQVMMQCYLPERLLERISLSSWRDCIVVKGGMLISSLIGVEKRSTKDLDTTVRGFPLTHESASEAFRQIVAVSADDDFEFEFVRTSDIRETDVYPGIRVHLLARYEKMSTPVTVDVTTGDKITPGAIEYRYPLMFDDRDITLMTYPLETIFAEKLEAVISRDVPSTRPRDYYGLYTLWLTRRCEVDSTTLREALEATSKKRGTFDDMGGFESVMARVAMDDGMLRQWETYVKRYAYASDVALLDACETVTAIMCEIGWE